MISLYLAMQNAIIGRNAAVSNMMQSSDRMLSSVGFGSSQPLKPSFAQADYDELQIKSNDTKVTVLQNLIDAMEESIGSQINRSTPKYAGVGSSNLDYRA